MNVSKGDFAYVVWATNPENEGVVVEVIRFVGEHTFQTRRVINDGWEVKFLSQTKASYRDGATGEIKSVWTAAGEQGIFSDSRLRRIAGPSVDIGEVKDIRAPRGISVARELIDVDEK